MKSNKTKTTTIHIHISDNAKKVFKFGIIAFVLLHVLVFTLYYIDEKTPKTKVTHEHTPIENPYDFDRNCYIAEVNSYSEDKNNITAAAKLLYERTGVQYYYVYLDIANSGADSEAYVRTYVDTYIDETIKNKDYALIRIQTNGAVIGQDEYGYDRYVGYLDEHYIGKHADDFFDSEGELLYLDYFDVYDCDWNTEDMYQCFDRTTDELLNYKNNQIKEIVIGSVVGVLIIGGIIFIIAYKLHRKEVEDTIRILNTPIDDAADDLVDEYLNKDKR